MSNIKIFGNTSAGHVFIQHVDDHDMEVMDNQIQILQKEKPDEWCLVTVKVNNWNHDLTPWEAEPVFGKQGFGDGASTTLDTLVNDILPSLQEECANPDKKLYLCGYSLAGLFALWSSYQTDVFEGIVAASPSVWYKDWISYVENNEIKTHKVYLSLGDKEEKAKNPVMASVGEAIRRQYEVISDKVIDCILEFNQGNHFVDSDKRTARGILWMMERT